MNKSHQVPHYSLWKSWREEGDAESGEQLTKHYLPLVDYAAQRLMTVLSQRVAKEDLISMGYMGLLDALKKFDYERGLKFSTFGMWRIRGAMIDGLREIDWAPRSLREKGKKIDEAFQILEQKYMRPPSEKEAAAYLSLTEQELQKVISDISFASLISLDEPIMDEEDQKQTRLSHVIDEKLQNPDQIMEREGNKQILAEAIERLPEKEKTVVSLLYNEELTLTEIAEVMGLSPSRISQLHSKAIFRLRGALGRYKQLLI